MKRKKNQYICSTSKLGARKPKETPLDSVLAARTTSFLAGSVVRSCRDSKPNLKDEHFVKNWDTNLVELRGERSGHAHTVFTGTVATAMADKLREGNSTARKWPLFYLLIIIFLLKRKE